MQITLLTVILVLFAFAEAGTLFGIRNVGLTGGAQMVTIEPKTARYSAAGPVLEDQSVAQELSSLDEKRKLYYFISYDDAWSSVQLLGLDLSNGKIKYNVSLPFSEAMFQGVGQTVNVDPATGDLFVSGVQKGKVVHDVFRVTPSTGNLTHIAEIGFGDVIGGINGYDPSTKLLWIEFFGAVDEQDLFAIDVTTGNTVHKVKNAANMQTFSFDPQTKLFYGIGGHNGSFVLLTFDGKTTKFNTIAKLSGFVDVDQELQAIDVTNRKLFGAVQTSASQKQDLRPLGKLLKRDVNKDTYEFITINLTNGAIESRASVLDLLSFPWSIEYLN